MPSFSSVAYQGCYQDHDAPNRNLPLRHVDLQDRNTPTACALACASAGHEFFGVEFGRECHCGAALPDGSSEAAAEEDCAENDGGTACSGNPGLTCGGPARLAIFQLQQHPQSNLLLINFSS